MRNISKSTTTRLCPTVTPHSLTRPLTFLIPMVIRMRRTDSPVRATPCQPHSMSDALRPLVHGFRACLKKPLPLPKGEGWGEGEADVQLRVGLSQTYGL